MHGALLVDGHAPDPRPAEAVGLEADLLGVTRDAETRLHARGPRVADQDRDTEVADLAVDAADQVSVVGDVVVGVAEEDRVLVVGGLEVLAAALRERLLVAGVIGDHVAHALIRLTSERELTPVQVEVLFGRRQHVLERKIAALRDVEGARERQLHDCRRIRCVLGAALRAPLDALLERVDPVEAGPVRALVRGITADRVAELEHAGEALVEIAGVELEQFAVTVGDVLHPRAGEAVGLLPGQDGGRELGPRLGLDHVTPLVRQHLRECERAELLVQAREEILIVVVDGHVERTMERVVLEVFVGGATARAVGD